MEEANPKMWGDAQERNEGWYTRDERAPVDVKIHAGGVCLYIRASTHRSSVSAPEVAWRSRSK